jgi:hypothetical protein
MADIGDQEGDTLSQRLITAVGRVYLCVDGILAIRKSIEALS